uniref:Uncharacterized protein n=1 Tax=Glossina austeni TaxID=7395 RepID=A0A1A9UYD4_GLOAU
MHTLETFQLFQKERRDHLSTFVHEDLTDNKDADLNSHAKRTQASSTFFILLLYSGILSTNVAVPTILALTRHNKPFVPSFLTEGLSVEVGNSDKAEKVIKIRNLCDMGTKYGMFVCIAYSIFHFYSEA